MDGVRYQIEQLQHALGQLDTHRMLPHEDASQLQLALANATAIARRVVAHQTFRNLKIHSAKSDNLRGSNTSVIGYGNSFSPLQATRSYEAHSEAAHVPTDNDDGGIVRSNVVDVKTYMKNEDDKRRSRSNESLEQQSCFETICSVARLHHISVDGVRIYNPQLSEFAEDEVLPPNTFIKMKLHMNEYSQFTEVSDLPISIHRTGEPLLAVDDTMMAEIPLPLAPLPDMQDAPRRSSFVADPALSYTQSNDDGGHISGYDDPSKRTRLLMLPSPSPNRRCFSQENSINISNTKDDRDSVGFPVELPVNIPGNKNFTKTIALTSIPVSNPIFLGPRAGKLLTTANGNITINTKNDNANGAAATSMVGIRVGDYGNSLMTESSFFSTPSSTPYASPNPKQPNIKEDTKYINNEDNATSPRVKLTGEINPPAVCNGVDDILCGNNELSPIIKESPSPVESDEDFDSLGSIAQKYKVTLKDVLKWNPYLIVYEADEPLPPNLPIVLPLQQN